MKQISLLLFVVLVAVACQPDLPPLPSEKAASTNPTSSTTGRTTATTGTTDKAAASTTTGATTGTTTGTATNTTGTTSDATTAQQSQPGDIPQRIFQLRQLEHATITGGKQPIDAFVADDDVKAKEGFMWVTNKDFKDSQGMIFVMPSAQTQSFWMQNTLIPLDIIYLDADGKVVNIVHGKPKDETSLPSTGPALYVLELKDGMASKLGIGPKSKLNLPKTLKYRGDQQPSNSPMSFPGQ